MISRKTMINGSRLLSKNLVRSFTTKNKLMIEVADEKIAIENLSDKELNEIYTELRPVKGFSKWKLHSLRNPLLRKYNFHVVDFLRGAQHAMDVLCDIINSPDYRKYIEKRNPDETCPEQEFVSSVCSHSACMALQQLALYETVADEPLRDFKKSGVGVLNFLMPRYEFSSKIFREERRLTLRSLLSIDIKVMAKDEGQDPITEENAESPTVNHSEDSTTKTESASSDAGSSGTCGVMTAARVLTPSNEAIDIAVDIPAQISDTKAVEEDVSVVIRTEFDLHSIVEGKYVTDLVPDDILPLNEIAWSSKCRVYFQCNISDGDEQEWRVSDIVVLD